MAETPVQNAIGLGAGRGPDEVYHMNWGDYIYYDKDGKYMNPYDPEGNFVNPADSPNYDHRGKGIPITIGKLFQLPFWDEDLLRKMVKMEEFARPDMEDQINQWLSEGFESYQLIDKVKEAKGLITLSDVGLEIVEEIPNEPAG